MSKAFISLTASPEAKGQRLDKYLTTVLAERGITRSRLHRIFEAEAVSVNGKKAAARLKLRGGEALKVELPEARSLELKPAKIPLKLLFEDEHLLIINKQAGLVTHPGAGHQDDTLVNALLNRGGKKAASVGGTGRPGIVHRLDKDTTGCLVVAKTEAAFVKLQTMVSRHDLVRIYLALVWGDLREDSGTIDAPLGRGADRKKMALRAGGKEAVTHFKVRQRYGSGLACELECTLETGRTHQIRAHLLGIKHPVVCDATYGRQPGHVPVPFAAALAKALQRQALHAWKLKFKHPITGKLVSVEAPEPADYKAARQQLKKGS